MTLLKQNTRPDPLSATLLQDHHMESSWLVSGWSTSFNKIGSKWYSTQSNSPEKMSQEDITYLSAITAITLAKSWNSPKLRINIKMSRIKVVFDAL